jgi:glucosamine--fructose-6-phosphate aminotransferase (isomerizing)
VAATCHPDTPLAARASTVWAVPGGEDGTVVMLRSFTTLLVLLQSAMAKTAGAGLRWVDLLRGGFDAMLAASRAWSRVLEDDGRAPRRAVMLGGGVRYAIALEGMLKAAEMSNQPVEAYVPLEYRHGPWGSLTRGDAVILLGQRQAADWEARLLSDLRARTETLLVVGAEHSRPTDTAAGIWYSSDIPDLWAGPLAVVPLQVFAWTWAIMGGRDPDAPQNLSKVVDLDG